MGMEPNVRFLGVDFVGPILLVGVDGDEIEEQWHYYIGTGRGRDLEEDVERIMECGQKFYDLSFIQDFCREPVSLGEKQLPGQMDIDDVIGG